MHTSQVPTQHNFTRYVMLFHHSSHKPFYQVCIHRLPSKAKNIAQNIKMGNLNQPIACAAHIHTSRNSVRTLAATVESFSVSPVQY